MANLDASRRALSKSIVLTARLPSVGTGAVSGAAATRQRAAEGRNDRQPSREPAPAIAPVRPHRPRWLERRAMDAAPRGRPAASGFLGDAAKGAAAWRRP